MKKIKTYKNIEYSILKAEESNVPMYVGFIYSPFKYICGQPNPSSAEKACKKSIDYWYETEKK